MPCRARIWAWRYSGQWSAYFATMTWATNRSVGRPPSISRAGAARLHHRFLACAAGVFRPPRHDHLVLRRDDVEPLRAIFADHVHRAAAAWAGGVFRFDDDLDPRQVLGQRAAASAPLLRTGFAQRRIGLLLFGLGLRRLPVRDLPSARLNWSGIELFRAPAELHSLQLAKQVAQPVVLPSELIALFGQPPLLGPLGVTLRPCRQHQGAQRGNVVGKGVCRVSSRSGLSHVASAVRSSTSR